MSVTVPQQRGVTDWRRAYLDLIADEKILIGSKAWSLGYAEGQVAGRREVDLLLLDEVVYRLAGLAQVRSITAELAKSSSLEDLNSRRYPGVTPQRLAELRGLAATEVQQVEQQYASERRWAA